MQEKSTTPSDPATAGTQDRERRMRKNTMDRLTDTQLYDRFEGMYRKYNRKEYIHPDPLEFVLRFEDPADQEIVGLIASGLAYGRVGNILQSLERIFHVLSRPSADLAVMGRNDLLEEFGSFRHRWTTGKELACLLGGMRILRDEYGSLENCFLKGLGEGHQDVIPALMAFVEKLRSASGARDNSMLACPSMGSACKRMFLYLRWMVRRDEVDPGPWRRVSSSQLIIPMDVHMHRVSRRLCLTSRKQPDLKSALEVTGFFRGLVPEDPVRYDFALTRPGIRSQLEPAAVNAEFQAESVHLC
jgi:uncharacterized protein (TIGR02757 family)